MPANEWKQRQIFVSHLGGVRAADDFLEIVWQIGQRWFEGVARAALADWLRDSRGERRRDALARWIQRRWWMEREQHVRLWWRPVSTLENPHQIVERPDRHASDDVVGFPLI